MVPVVVLDSTLSICSTVESMLLWVLKQSRGCGAALRCQAASRGECGRRAGAAQLQHAAEGPGSGLLLLCYNSSCRREKHCIVHQLLPARQVKEARELVQRSCERQLEDLRAQATSAHDAVHELERTLDRRLAIARWQHAFEVLGTRHRQGHLQSGGHAKGQESLVPKVRCSQTRAMCMEARMLLLGTHCCRQLGGVGWAPSCSCQPPL